MPEIEIKYKNLYGNKNAEKWNFRKAIKLFRDAIELSNKKNENGYEFDFIGEISRELNTFHQIFSHLVRRFPVLQRLHSQLLSNLESNCYFNSKKENINVATGIVNLKANYNWNDKSALTIQHSGSISSETLAEQKEAYEKEIAQHASLLEISKKKIESYV